jgi:hypothetical protein
MFNMVNQSLGIGTYVFPNAQQSFPMSPSGQTNPPFIVLTNRWDEVAEVEMQFGSFENLPWMTYANISVRGGFGCMVAIDYVYFEGNPSAADLFLIFGVPLLLVALLVGLGLLKWAFPDLCVCKKRADEMGVEDDEKSLEAARQREARRLKGLGEPLVLHEKMGMTTWLDEAEDVVVDLNTNCQYIAEAQLDAQGDKNITKLTGSADPELQRNDDGFHGGRRVFAVGNAAVREIDHKVTMQMRKSGDDEEEDIMKMI